MPMPFYMSMTGTTQGNMTQGAGIQTGHEDEVLCQAQEHEVYIPRDPQSGQPTGQRVHKAITITKVFDKASPKLYQALVTGERMTDVTFKYFRISPAGAMEHYFTVKLDTAIIVSVRSWIPNCLDPAKETFTHMEDISFTYTKIGWTWEIDGIAAEDSWLVRK